MSRTGLDRVCFGFIFVVLMACPANCANGDGLTNPTPANALDFTYDQGQTAPRRKIRDPCIIREADRYYLVFTMWPFRNREEKHLADADQGSSPGIALYSSHDLRNWTFENWLIKSSDL